MTIADIASTPPGMSIRRARKIASLHADIDRLRTVVLSAMASLDTLETELHQLVRLRHRRLTRDALTLLRKSSEPLPLRAPALRLVEARGLNTADAKETRRMTKRLRLLLRRQRDAGVVRAAGGKEPQVWSIVG